MGGIFNIKPSGSPASNKPQGGWEEKIEADKSYPISYWYDVEGYGCVYVTIPFIDKLSVTLPASALSNPSGVYDRLKQAPKLAPDAFQKAMFGKSKYGVRITYKHPNYPDGALIEVNPPAKGGGKPYLRLEFNPTALTLAGLRQFKADILGVTNGDLSWDHVVDHGKCTRIDFAVDMINAPASQLLIESAVPGKSHLYIGPDGSVQTSYVGIKPTQTNSGLIAYDKSLQLQEKGQSGNHLKIIHTRVETVYKSSSKKLKDIGDISDPFSALSVIHPGSSPPQPVDQVYWDLFLDRCRLMSTANALTKDASAFKQVLSSQLATLKDTTWKPKKLWSTWNFVLKYSELLRKTGDPLPAPAFTFGKSVKT